MDEITSKLTKLNILNMGVWNAWTTLSEGMQFKSTISGIGDGEMKLGKEVNTTPLGQNYSHDLNVNGEKWEVKKLDANSSFRLGVEINESYSNVVQNVINMFTNITNDHEIKQCSFFDELVKQLTETTKKCKTSILDGFKKHEISASNLVKANNIIENLKQLTFDLDHKQIKLYNSITGNKQSYNVTTGYKKLLLENLPTEKIIKILGTETFYKVHIHYLICNNILFFKDKTLIEKLSDVVKKYFINKKLVFVDPKKGYYIVNDIDKLECNRITQGHPRCKYDI